MENLETYIAFDLEFNTEDGDQPILSKYRLLSWIQHEEVDSLILSSIRMFLCNPLSMVWLGITADKICQGTKARVCFSGF